jgi:hypothetical protein
MEKFDKRLIEDGPRRTGWLWAFNELALRGRYIKELGNFSTPSGGWKKIGAPRPEYAKEAETLSDLLVAVAGLRYLGAPDTIREKIEDAQKASAYNREMEWIPEKERGKISTPLEALEQRLRYIYTRAVVAEDLLQKAGWRFNPSTRKASRIAKNRGRDLLGECVWAIYTERYQEEYSGASAAKKRSIRRKIAAVLAPYFDAAELSPESEAPIYFAIRNRERSPK